MHHAFRSLFTSFCAVLVFFFLPLTSAYSARTGTAAVAGSLTVTGRWTFTGRDGASSADQMMVEIVRGDTGEHLASCTADITGAFTCGPFSNPGAAGVRARLLTYTRLPPAGDVLAVINPDTGTTSLPENAYAATTDARQFPDGIQDIGLCHVPGDHPALRAFWVEQDLLRAARYFWDEAGVQQVPPQTAGPLTVEWKPGRTQATRIELPDRVYLSGDAPLSKTVVNHQYGHAIMYRAYGGHFPGEPCASTVDARKVSTTGCAWTEGWADFFSLAVNHDPVYRWENGALINLETPTWGEADWDDGDAVEARIAGALWDLLDIVNDGKDDWGEVSILNIWQTLTHRMDNTFHDYWINWLASGENYPNAVMSIYQNTIDYRNPLPTITGFSPAGKLQAECAFNLTVYGSSFIPNWTKVRWNGYDKPTTFVSSTELTATITTDDIASPGSVPVTVSNASPGGGISNKITFPIEPVAVITPRIEMLSPNLVHAEGPGFTLSIQGCGFVSGSRVFWNGSERHVSSTSPAELKVVIPPADIALPGEAIITVINPQPGGDPVSSEPATLRVLPLQPVITVLEPGWAFTGSKDITLKIRGTRFTPQAVVLWEGQALATTYTSASELAAAIPASLLGYPRTAHIVVDSSGAGENPSAAAFFQVYAPVFLPYLGR